MGKDGSVTNEPQQYSYKIWILYSFLMDFIPHMTF